MRRLTARKAIVASLLLSVLIIVLVAAPEAASATAVHTAVTVHADVPGAPGLPEIVGQLLQIVSQLLAGLGAALPS